MDLFRTKEVEGETKDDFKKDLGGFQLILLGIGAIVGSGIFVVTGIAAAQHAGPAIAIAFVLSALGCLFAGLCYAEFASMIPLSGSAYTYAYATVGELVAWIIGWDLILEYMFGASTVAASWSRYVSSFLSGIGIHLPAWLSGPPIEMNEGHWMWSGAVLNLPAILIVVFITAILIVGITESASVNAVIVLIKITVIILFLVVCAPHVDPANWTPFIPPNAGATGKYGITGILAGAGVIFYAYIGFDAVTTTAQEVKKPGRDLPIGILGSLLICTVLYIAVSLVLTGVVNYTKLDVPAPIAFAVQQVGPTVAWIRPFIELGAIAGLSSVILVLLLGQPRIFYRMAADGLLPPIFSKIHPRFKTPYVTTALTGVLTAMIAGLLPVSVLSELVSIGTLLAFVIVCVSVIILRRTKPDIPRQFRTPWVPWVPVAGALICLIQMVFLPPETIIRLFVWLAIGLLIYFLYGRRHSRLHRPNS